MKAALILCASMLLVAGSAFAGDDDRVSADKPSQSAEKPRPVRVQMNQVRSWSSDDDHQLLLTTNRREQFLIRFERPCRGVSRGPMSNALVTESTWLDRNSHVRILHRDLLPSGTFEQAGGVRDFRVMTHAYSTLCAIDEITALGKAPPRGSAKR